MTFTSDTYIERTLDGGALIHGAKMRKADLAAWGIDRLAEGRLCAMCDSLAAGICLAASTLVCGVPLCAKCECPTHHEGGYAPLRRQRAGQS